MSETEVKGQAGLAFVVGIPVSDRFCHVQEETWWNELVSRGALMTEFPFLCAPFCLYSSSGHFSVESVTYPLNLQPKTYF